MKAYRQRKKKKIEEKLRSRRLKKEAEEEMEIQRTYWRERKREQRQKKRKQIHDDDMTTTLDSDCNTTGEKATFSKVAKRSAAFRVKGLPKDPEKFCKTVEHIVENATPTKQRILKDSGVLNTPKTKKKNKAHTKIVNFLKERNDKLKRKRSLTARRSRLEIINIAKRAKATKDCQQVREALGLTWSRLVQSSVIKEELDERKRRSDALPEQDKVLIEEYYEALENSTPLSSASSVANDTARKVLREPLHKLHRSFMKATGKKVGLTLFRRIKPKHILKMSLAKFRACLCETCTNMDEINISIQKFAHTKGISLPKLSNLELSKLTLCDIITDACLERKCKQCGVKVLDEIFKDVLLYKQHTVSWHRWETVKVSDKAEEGELSEKPSNRRASRKGKENFSVQPASKSAKKGKLNMSGKPAKKGKETVSVQPASKSAKKGKLNMSGKTTKRRKTVQKSKSEKLCKTTKKSRTSGKAANQSKPKTTGKSAKKSEISDNPAKKNKPAKKSETSDKPEKKRKPKSKKQFVAKETTIDELLLHLKKEMQTFSKHLFDAVWQIKQYQQLRKNLPPNSVLMVLDFAENFRTVYQREIQSARWGYSQVTVHPIVCFMKCGQPDCSSTVTEYNVVISPILTHGSTAVKMFSKVVMDDLSSRFSFTKVFQMTDGCSAQYKSKRPFLHISSQRDVEVERSYFGSGHGKGPCDSTAAVVKQACYKAVKNEKAIIKDAQDMFAFLQKNKTLPEAKELHDDSEHSHVFRKFFFVGTAETEPEIKVNTFKGTRSVHTVRSTGTPGVLQYRNRSCYCQVCLGGGKCSNCLIDDWKEMDIRCDSDSDSDNDSNLCIGCDDDSESNDQPSRKSAKKLNLSGKILEAKKSETTGICKETAKSMQKKRPIEDTKPEDVKRKKQILVAKKSETTGSRKETRSMQKKRPIEDPKPEDVKRKKKMDPVKESFKDKEDIVWILTDHEENIKKDGTKRTQEREEEDMIDWKEIKRTLIHSPYPNQLQYVEDINIPSLQVQEDLDVASGRWEVDDVAGIFMEGLPLPGTVKWPSSIYGDGMLQVYLGTFDLDIFYLYSTYIHCGIANNAMLTVS